MPRDHRCEHVKVGSGVRGIDPGQIDELVKGGWVGLGGRAAR